MIVGCKYVDFASLKRACYSEDSLAHHTPLTSANISAALNQAATYLCTLSYDANGTLASYNFKEV